MHVVTEQILKHICSPQRHNCTVDDAERGGVQKVNRTARKEKKRYQGKYLLDNELRKEAAHHACMHELFFNAFTYSTYIVAY